MSAGEHPLAAAAAPHMAAAAGSFDWLGIVKTVGPVVLKVLMAVLPPPRPTILQPLADWLAGGAQPHAMPEAPKLAA